MKSFGEILRKIRKGKKIPLKAAAAYISIKPAALRKIERNQAITTHEQVIKLAKYFNYDEGELIIAWLSDKLTSEKFEEQNSLKVLKTAEEKIAYKGQLKINRNKLLNLLRKKLAKFKKINKAWIYGSFARGDYSSQSDIDIAVLTDDDFSYFDLAEIQHELEKEVEQKIDIGFIDSFKSYVFERVKPELKLIYER